MRLMKQMRSLAWLLIWSGSSLLAVTSDDLSRSDPKLFKLRIAIVPDEVAALRKQPRKYVTARVEEGSNVFENVGVHLKGAVGSFRSIDDKPGLTLSFSKQASNRTFHGSSKIHLNNSVEDPSYLNEKLGTILFARAGIPAPAVHHALIELNGRRLGLYVLKEGFTPEFLARNFADPTGNLYDTDTAREITDNLQRDIGNGPNNDLKKLAQVAQLSDAGQRWERLPEVLDLSEFVSFVAMEIMIKHRDGYSLARNNYRLYHNPQTRKFVFLPHGMDQLFHRPDSQWNPAMSGLLAQVLLSRPEGERMYRERLQSLVTNAFDVPLLTKEADRTVAQIAPSLTRKEASSMREAADDLKRRITRRKAFLERELAKPPPRSLEFANGPVLLANWATFDSSTAATIDLLASPDGSAALHIQGGLKTTASWRQTVLLDRGDYRFEARVVTRGVAPLPFGKHSGACVRTEGQSPPQAQRLMGDNGWNTLSTSFSVTRNSQSIELICELRASKGEAWFDASSLKLVRVR